MVKTPRDLELRAASDRAGIDLIGVATLGYKGEGAPVGGAKVTEM